MVRIGIGGWSFPPWRETFYPPGLPARRELEHASRAMTAIEVNATFYRTQSPETFARWRAETPDGFVFAVKAPRYATNRKALAEAGESAERFAASGIAELGDKLGPLNWQLAPTKTFDPDEIAAFLGLLPREAGGIPLRHAIEVRHESFAAPAFVDLCRAAGVAIVLAGDSKHPVIDADTADFAYWRLMGTTDEDRGYPPALLAGWADRARTIGKPLDCFIISGAKAWNPAAATALQGLL